jgi:serine/threonine protein phosphatase 1
LKPEAPCADDLTHTGRTFAIGDIHGCSTALGTLLAAMDSPPEYTIVALGDYVD